MAPYSCPKKIYIVHTVNNMEDKVQINTRIMAPCFLRMLYHNIIKWLLNVTITNIIKWGVINQCYYTILLNEVMLLSLILLNEVICSNIIKWGVIS